MNQVKKFLKNKNVITVIGVVLIVGLLYAGYRYTIDKAVEPKRVPVAVETINPRTEITSDMIEYIEVAGVAVSENTILDTNSIVGKYSNINTVIPAGSMFYKETVIDKEDLPDIVFTKLQKGETMYRFPVSVETTYGNAIYPGNYIDIYMKANNDDGKIMVGKLIENVKVLAVNDSSGNPVFEVTDGSRTPSMMLFGLKPDLYILLRKASYMSDGIELYPVPHGQFLDDDVKEGSTQVSTETLKNFIMAKTVDIPVTAGQ